MIWDWNSTSEAICSESTYIYMYKFQRFRVSERIHRSVTSTLDYNTISYPFPASVCVNICMRFRSLPNNHCQLQYYIQSMLLYTFEKIHARTYFCEIDL